MATCRQPQGFSHPGSVRDVPTLDDSTMDQAIGLPSCATLRIARLLRVSLDHVVSVFHNFIIGPHVKQTPQQTFGRQTRVDVELKGLAQSP